MRVTTGLAGIAIKATVDSKCRFTSLAHMLTPEFLKETWQQMNRRGAGGVDGETCAQFERDLDTRVVQLWERLKAGQYQASPVRRVDIPKPGDTSDTRPLGIPTVEDRLLQRAVARILSAIYEQDFMECSYGYRPGRNPHQALRALRISLIRGKGQYVHETDIRGYFTRINHDWLRKMVAHRIADPVILRLVGKWLRAGVMQDGVVVRTREGVSQGNPISPVLANVYLHYVLDLWFERRFKKGCRGEAHLIRFVDDFVAVFQYQADANTFERELAGRMQKFGLELKPEKTRVLRFGRFAQQRAAACGEKLCTFEFLGFKHVCGVDRKGKFAVVRIPAQDSCRKFLDHTYEWLKRHMHLPRRVQQAYLATMLRGFYQYFALHHCERRLDWIRHEVQLQWIRTLRRRSQRHRLFWSYLKSRSWFELPSPKTLHPTV
jgi:group II intron reverse transcriptase/maturase